MLDLVSVPIRYAIVGVFNTLLYAFLLYFFMRYINLARPMAVAISFILAMTVQYFANRIFTFGSSRRISSEIPRYLIVALINYFLTLLVLAFAMDYFELSAAWASIFASSITAFSGYILSVFWVFKE